MRVYIAGGMTGFPLYNFDAFQRARADWQRAGWEVITPFDTNSVVWARHYGRPFNPATDKCDYGDPILPEMIFEDFRAILESDACAFLPGWEKSRGASLEHRVALTMGRPVYDAATRMLLEPVAA